MQGWWQNSEGSRFPRSAHAKSEQAMKHPLMFRVDANMKRIGIRFKKDSFFWEKIMLYTVH